MDKLISDFTVNIDEAYAIAQKIKLRLPSKELKNVLICGMGGSGIGGKLVSQWIQHEIKIPIILCQDYTIPEFVNENTLVIGSSYSGNTEETLTAIYAAKKKNAHIICISSGGEISAFCQENGYDVITVRGGNQPRAAIAYSLVQLIHVFTNLGLISDQPMKQLLTGKKLIEKNLASNKVIGKEIANFIFGKLNVIYAEAIYEGVAIRARQQFDENSKNLGWSLVIPEMNHNELVGWGGGSDQLAVIFLRTKDANPRNSRRMDLSKEIISRKTKYIYELHAKGESTIEQSLYFINVLDWASYYLYKLNKVDVFDIKAIDYLKDSLAKM